MKTNNTQQVAAFDQVLGHCNALGAKYNPSKDSIKVAALTSLLTSAQASVTAAETARLSLLKAINIRQAAFIPIPGIGTRILNMMIAADAPPELIADIRKYRDKLRGVRPGKTVKPEDSTNTTQPADASRGPVSYLDFHSKADNFERIVNLIKGDPLYKPNEPEFSIANLTTLVASLRAKNKAVYDAKIALGNARIATKVALHSDAGLYGATKRVKRYILFAFGATSEQFRAINSITIKSK
jgi:hypothetical protein